jgi:hypothetical protein
LISHFSAVDFLEVIDRCERLGLQIIGIETFSSNVELLYAPQRLQVAPPFSQSDRQTPADQAVDQPVVAAVLAWFCSGFIVQVMDRECVNKAPKKRSTLETGEGLPHLYSNLLGSIC